jgi:hypothetical protein
MKKQLTNSKLEIIYLPVSSLVKLPGAFFAVFLFYSKNISP